MSDVLRLQLSVADRDASTKVSFMPSGTIVGMCIDDYSTHNYRLGRNNTEVALPMLGRLAWRLLRSFERHQAHASPAAEQEHRRKCGNNCLTLLAELLGRPVTGAEQFKGNSGPVPLADSYVVAQNRARLKPDTPHAALVSGRILHGFLSTRLPDRMIDVNGSTWHGVAEMRFASVSSIVLGPEDEIIELKDLSYASTHMGAVALC